MSDLIRLRVFKLQGVKGKTIILGDERIKGLELSPGDRLLDEYVLDVETMKDAIAEWEQRPCKCFCHLHLHQCDVSPICCEGALPA